MKTWQIINELLNRSKKKSSGSSDAIKTSTKTLTTEKEISEYMNNYYKNIAKEIEGKINKSKFDYKHYLEKSKQSEEPFNLLETYENEVQETIKSMSNKASVGPDGISNKIIKKISPFIIKELTTCINKSFKGSYIYRKYQNN